MKCPSCGAAQPVVRMRIDNTLTVGLGFAFGVVLFAVVAF